MSILKCAESRLYSYWYLQYILNRHIQYSLKRYIRYSIKRAIHYAVFRSFCAMELPPIKLAILDGKSKWRFRSFGVHEFSCLHPALRWTMACQGRHWKRECPMSIKELRMSKVNHHNTAGAGRPSIINELPDEMLECRAETGSLDIGSRDSRVQPPSLSTQNQSYKCAV